MGYYGFMACIIVIFNIRGILMVYVARYLILTLFITLFNGCGYTPPVNLTVAKKQVEIYYEAGRYDADLKRIVDNSINYFKKITPGEKSVVIFDVDDTVLTDYKEAKAMSFGYIPKLSHEWIIKANAPEIKEVKRLYDYLVKRGFRIIFMTGRKFNEHEATIENLKKRGFNTFDKLIVRQEHELKLIAVEYKSFRRKELSKEGYEIVGTIGDQFSDLEGGFSGYKIKLPNYKYMIE